MKRPPDHHLAKLLRWSSIFSIQRWLVCAIIGTGLWCGPARAQTFPPDKKNTRSISGQFIVIGPAQFSPLASQPRIAADTNLVRLDPALLVISAERIREMLWRKLEIKGPWRGQVYLLLHPARALDENVTITASRAASGWSYRVELPDVLSPTRFARALTGVLLLEFANRDAATRSAEVPAWLTDGLSQQWLAAGSPEFLLSSPDKAVNGLPVTRLQKTQRGVDPLAGARPVLKNHPALTFDELSWPTGTQLDGDDDGVYRASAQLFVSEMLRLKNGPAHLRAMLASLPQFYNWQVAFQSAFREDFPRPLDLEKWWALAVVNFAARDPGPGWTLAVSRTKLDEILRVPVALRTTADSLPEHTEISLQAIIRNLEPARQAAILQTKLRDLELAQLRIARPYAVVTAEYRRALGSYLGGQPAQTWATRLYRSLRDPSAASTIKKLDALDARRRNIAATAQPEPSAQPSLAPLKFQLERHRPPPVNLTGQNSNL